MTLWTLLQAAVLCMNAGAILNEERFLDKCACRRSSPLVQLETGLQPFSIPHPPSPSCSCNGGQRWATHARRVLLFARRLTSHRHLVAIMQPDYLTCVC
jgi:hypothetical protein